MKISKQLDLTRTVINALDDEHRQLHHMATMKTLEKLQCVYDELLSISCTIKPKGPGDNSASESSLRGLGRTRAKYAFKKQQLDAAIMELESWQHIHDNSWLMIIHMAKGMMTSEEQLRVPVGAATSLATTAAATVSRDSFLPISVLHSAVTTCINMSDNLVATIGNEEFIIDTFSCARPPKGMACAVSRDVRSLVRKLQINDTQRPGLLRCKGAMKEDVESTTQFSLLFRFPPHSSRPQCLREALQSGTQPSLSDIVKIGQHIAEAISFVHVSGFVHKNIRPETILVYRDVRSTSPSAFLAGFEKFRLDGGLTAKLGDDSWAQNVYCHPDRCGTSLNQAYIMQHDIYSLGVCLLEIGLWQSFIHQNRPGTGFNDLFESTDSSQRLFASLVGINYASVKDGLVSMAESRLPSRVGTLYANVVKTCLTCLDTENNDFGDESEFLDLDGILVGVRYIEKVCLKPMLEWRELTRVGPSWVTSDSYLGPSTENVKTR